MAENQELVDDLADVLIHMVVGWQAGDILPAPLTEHPAVQRVLKRYRVERKGANG